MLVRCEINTKEEDIKSRVRYWSWGTGQKGGLSTNRSTRRFGLEAEIMRLLHIQFLWGGGRIYSTNLGYLEKPLSVPSNEHLVTIS